MKLSSTWIGVLIQPKKEINEIVFNQYRGQYDKAAQELIACAEMISNVKGETEAYGFITRIRALYPRHTSFAKSVNSVLKQTNIEYKLS